MKKTRVVDTGVAYGHNENIHIYTELNFGNIVIHPGMEIKIKSHRGTFIFKKWVHNSALDVTWVDCMDKATGEFRSFYLDRLKMVVLPKKSRAKKVNV